LIVGFVVKGDTPLRLIVRAIGPSLDGLQGELADPKLSVYRGSTLVKSNDNWGGTSALSTAFTLAKLSALSTTSRDSAMDITLSPGTYSATVTGVNSGTGIGQLEIVELR